MKEKRILKLLTPILISIVCVWGGLVLCHLIGNTFPQRNANERYIQDIVPRVITSLVLIMFMKLAYRDITIGLGKKGFLQGIAISFLMYLYIVENFIDGSSVNATVEFTSISPIAYVLCFLSTMAIGLFEEVLLRGTVLNIMRKYFREWKYGLFGAVFGSSFLFGIIHMINYFGGKAYLRPTVAQVFYATFLGLFMGAVYVRCDNLWVVILLHGLFDFAAEFWELVTPNYDFSKQDISWSTVQYLVMLYLPLALAGCYITWRADQKEKESLWEDPM